MYRYYTINEPKDGSLSFPGTPAKTHGYGQNGVSFECVRECVYGYAEYAEELDAQTVKAHRLIAGPIPVYYPINEDMARREKEMMSFSDYRAGSKPRNTAAWWMTCPCWPPTGKGASTPCTTKRLTGWRRATPVASPLT